MKIAVVVLAAALAGAGAATARYLCASAGARGAVRAHYVEARTASVYAGACHYNGELTTQGREALLAWDFTGGERDGISLAGVDAVAAVSAEKNLDEPDAARTSVVYLDARASEEQRSATLSYLRERHASALGEIEHVETVDLDVDCDGERYDVRVGRAGEVAELRGAALPDRGCCTMPTNVWYEPFVRLDARLVGNSEVFRYDDPALGRKWSRAGANDAFVGSLRAFDCCAKSGCTPERAVEPSRAAP